MKIDFSILGANAIERSLEDRLRAAKAAGARSLYESGNNIMGESKEDYCPVDVGNLRASGFVAEPEEDGDVITVVMGYGGAASDYALAVHEIDKNYHNGKQWKYLETPFRNNQRKVIEKLKRDIDNG